MITILGYTITKELVPWAILSAFVALVIIVAAIWLPILIVKKHRKKVEAKKKADAEAKIARLTKEREDAPIKRWLQIITAVATGFYKETPEGDKRILAAGDPPAYKKEWQEAVDDALEIQIAAQERMNAIYVLEAEANATFAHLRELDDDTEDLFNQIEDAREAHSEYILDEDDKWAEDRLNELFDRYCVMLLKQAVGGDSESFTKLRELQEVGDWPPEDVYPPEWKEAVAQHIKHPTWWDFGMPELPVQDAQYEVARVLRTESLTEAKLILAYCEERAGASYYNRIREVQWAFLVEMVEELTEQHEFDAAVANINTSDVTQNT
jgi:hypothetical protein